MLREYSCSILYFFINLGGDKMEGNRGLLSDKQDKTNFMDIFDIINAKLRVLYVLAIIFISISLFLTKIFVCGIVNCFEEGANSLYYFIPVAVSTIFSFILPFIVARMASLFYSMRLSSVERIWGDLKKSKKI